MLANLSTDFIKKAKVPILCSLFFLIIIIATHFIVDYYVLENNNWNIIIKSIKYIFILSVSWLFFQLIEFVLEKDISLKIAKKKAANTVFKLLDTVFKSLFFAILFLYSLDYWGVDITKFLAAGGIFGLAIGLAARDFLSNLFGGLVIFLDKPFSEGEWICSPDRQIEGTVKKIKLRVTEIETFDKRPLYVPNSTFLNIIIENPNRMENRRICEDFSLRYKDAKQIKKIVYEIEKYLKENPAIKTEATTMVHLTRFATSSLDCQIYCFTETSDWKLYREIRQEVMLKIVEIVKDNKAELAFPTRTIEWQAMNNETTPAHKLPKLNKKALS